MKINFLHCSRPEGKNKTNKLINSAKQIVKDIAANFTSSSHWTSEDTNSSNDYIQIDHLGVNGPSPSITNTFSEINLSNVFEQNPQMVSVNSFVWPEVSMAGHACNGHECLNENSDINQKILYQPNIRAKKPKFTPPYFAKSGIIPCPNVKITEALKETNRPIIAIDHVVDYTTPGNMEFMAFTYPKIDHSYRYSTYAIPNNRFEWEWIYNYIYKIRKSFQRKYLSDLRLASEPGVYKGKIAYLVKIESGSQGNILRCRSGLPGILKNILVVPFNATGDINCYITEYLIKRKFVFNSLIAHRTNEKEDMNVSNIESPILTEPFKQMKEYDKNKEKIANTLYTIKTIGPKDFCGK